MQETDGSINASLAQKSVRPISDTDFDRIMQTGLQGVNCGSELASLAPTAWDFAGDPPARIMRTRVLSSRSMRTRAFSQVVGAAYRMRCAVTGLALRAPDGSSEVECAHIMPIETGGPDSIRKGLALSRSIHWMFDKRLISIGGDGRILRSRHCPDAKIDRLINGSERIILPQNGACYPHPEFLRYHRENVFLAGRPG